VYGGWMCDILPFVEQDNLKKAITFYPNFNAGAFFTNYTKPVPIFACPSDPRLIQNGGQNGFGGMTSYLGVTGNDNDQNAEFFGPTNGIFDISSTGIRLTDITDGTSNTLMVGERPPGSDFFWGWWSVSDFDCLLSVLNQVNFYPWTEPGISVPCSGPPGIYMPGTPQTPQGCHTNHFYGMHSVGACWSFGDASVHFLPYTSQPITVPMASRAGGEVFQPNY
jgi:hypothetical protein